MPETIGTAYIQIEPNAQGIQKSISEAISGGSSDYGSKLSGALAGAAKIGVAAIGTATAAVGGFAASSVQAGMSFDKSMSQVAATMGTTVDQIGDLSDFAQKMGSTTSFSATEAADALNYMALAGYDAETSMNMLPNVLNLAAAGGIDLARASDMVTDAASAMGLTLEDGSVDIERTTQMVDQMAKASSKSNTSVEQLGDAFLTIGATARNAKGGTQELSTMLGVMADNGIKGSEAGTHLRNIMLAMNPTTDKAAAAWERLGVEAYDADGKMRALPDIFQDLSVAMADMTDQEKTETLTAMFNKTDLASVNALLGTTTERYNELSDAIGDADGAAEEMAATQLDNLAGDITLFKSALEGAQIAVSDQLTPALRDFVKFGADGLSQITAAFKENGLSGAMEAFGQVLSQGLSMVVSMIPQFIAAGMQLLGALGQGLLDNLPVLIDAAVQIINQLLTGLVQALPALAEGAVQIITGLAEGIASMLPTLIPTIVDVVMQIVQTIVDNAPLLLEAGLQLIMGLAQGIIDSIPVLINDLPSLIESIVNFIIEAIPMLIDAGIQLMMGIVEALPTIIESLVNALPRIIEAVVNGLITALPLLIEGNIKLIMALVQALPQIMKALFEAIPEIIKSIVDIIVTSGPQLISGVVTILGSILSSIVSYGSQFLQNVGQNMSNILNTVVQWLSQLPTKMAYYAGYAIGQFIKFVAELPSKISEVFTKVITKVTTFGTNFKEKATTTAKNFATSLVNGITSLPSKIASLGQQLVGALKDLPSKFVSVGKDIVNGIWRGISNGWQALKDNVSRLAGSLLQGAKDALGIHSPSKVFAEGVGQWIPAGVAEGIEENMSTLDRAIDDMTNEAVSDTLDNNINAALNVKPYRGDVAESHSSNNVVSINVYAPEGMDINALAEVIQNKINNAVSQRELVYA